VLQQELALHLQFPATQSRQDRRTLLATALDFDGPASVNEEIERARVRTLARIKRLYYVSPGEPLYGTGVSSAVFRVMRRAPTLEKRALKLMTVQRSAAVGVFACRGEQQVHAWLSVQFVVYDARFMPISRLYDAWEIRASVEELALAWGVSADSVKRVLTATGATPDTPQIQYGVEMEALRSSLKNVLLQHESWTPAGQINITTWLKQVLATLAAIPAFSHLDPHCENIRMRPLGGAFTLAYQVSPNRYFVTHAATEVMPVLSDFGRASVVSPGFAEALHPKWNDGTDDVCFTKEARAQPNPSHDMRFIAYSVLLAWSDVYQQSWQTPIIQSDLAELLWHMMSHPKTTSDAPEQIRGVTRTIDNVMEALSCCFVGPFTDTAMRLHVAVKTLRTPMLSAAAIALRDAVETNTVADFLVRYHASSLDGRGFVALVETIRDKHTQQERRAVIDAFIATRVERRHMLFPHTDPSATPLAVLENLYDEEFMSSTPAPPVVVIRRST